MILRLQITRSDKVKGPVSVHRLIKDGIFPEKTDTSGNNEMNREIKLVNIRKGEEFKGGFFG